jgi:hypothetical protein
MVQDNSSLPGSGNASYGGISGSESRTPSADFTVGTSAADTARPTGTTTTSSTPTTSAAGSFQASGQSEGSSYERTEYQPAGRDLVLAERTRSRPSTAVIIGSAIAGAVAGGAIPFMLSGRKSSGTIALDERHGTQSTRSEDYGSVSGTRTRGDYQR